MKGSPAPASGTLHWLEASNAAMSGSRPPALARFALRSAASQAGAITTAGPDMRPAAMKSRRVRGRAWFSCSSGSPSACDRGGFLRMKNIGLSPKT